MSTRKVKLSASYRWRYNSSKEGLHYQCHTVICPLYLSLWCCKAFTGLEKKSQYVFCCSLHETENSLYYHSLASRQEKIIILHFCRSVWQITVSHFSCRTEHGKECTFISRNPRNFSYGCQKLGSASAARLHLALN